MIGSGTGMGLFMSNFSKLNGRKYSCRLGTYWLLSSCGVASSLCSSSLTCTGTYISSSSLGWLSPWWIVLLRCYEEEKEKDLPVAIQGDGDTIQWVHEPGVIFTHYVWFHHPGSCTNVAIRSQGIEGSSVMTWWAPT